MEIHFGQDVLLSEEGLLGSVSAFYRQHLKLLLPPAHQPGILLQCLKEPHWPLGKPGPRTLGPALQVRSPESQALFRPDSQHHSVTMAAH